MPQYPDTSGQLPYFRGQSREAFSQEMSVRGLRLFGKTPLAIGGDRGLTDTNWLVQAGGKVVTVAAGSGTLILPKPFPHGVLTILIQSNISQVIGVAATLNGATFTSPVNGGHFISFLAVGC